MSDLGRRRPIALLALLLALAAAAALLAAGPGTRLGFWHFRTGFLLLKAAFYCGLASAALALFALAGRSPAPMPAAWALFVGLVVAGFPLALMKVARRAPPIHDLSTDLADPPAFVAVLPLRKDAPNPPGYSGTEAAEAQRKAYPGLGSARLSAPPEEALRRAEEAARALGWEVVSVDAKAGRLEATDTTFWFGFKDDVVVRVRPDGAGSKVDARSKSRVGRGDAGANAARLRRFLSLLGR